MLNLKLRKLDGTIEEIEVNKHITFTPKHGEQFFFEDCCESYTFRLTDNDTSVLIFFQEGDKVYQVLLKNYVNTLQQNDSPDSNDIKSLLVVGFNSDGNKEINDFINDYNKFNSNEIIQKLKEQLEDSKISEIGDGVVIDDFKSLISMLEASAANEALNGDSAFFLQVNNLIATANNTLDERTQLQEDVKTLNLDDNNRRRFFDENENNFNIQRDRIVEEAEEIVTPSIPEKALTEVVMNISGTPSLLEGQTATYTISFDKPLIFAMPVALSILNLSTQNSDYASLVKDITIPSGVDSYSFTLESLDDVYKESNESYKITILNNNLGGYDNLRLETNSITTTILDNEDNVNLSLEALEIEVIESNNSKYKVKLTDDFGSEVIAKEDMSVSFTYRYTNSQKEDITELKTVIIKKNTSSIEFEVETLDDVYAEGTENFTLEIDNATNQNQFEKVTIDKTAVVTNITDEINPNEDNVNLRLEGLVTNIIEGNEAEYRIYLEDNDGNPVIAKENVTVNFAYAYTTASGLDITEVKTVLIEKGKSELAFTVHSKDDLIDEGIENFTIQIDTATNQNQFEKLTIDKSAVSTIIFDKGLMIKLKGIDTDVVEDEVSSYKVMIESSTGVPLSLSEDVRVSLIYRYTTASGEDITEVKIVELPKNQSEITFNIDSKIDFIQEGNENFYVSIDSVSSLIDLKNLIIDKTEVETIVRDGISIVNPQNSNVDEDNFTISSSSTISSTGNLGIVTDNGTQTQSYKLIVDETVVNNLSSNGVKVLYDFNTEGKVIAYLEGGDSISAKVFELILNKNAIGGADDSYTFTQFKNLDHPLKNSDDNIELDFGFKIDTGSDTSFTKTFKVIVNDSMPSGSIQNLQTVEDNDIDILISVNGFKNDEITINGTLVLSSNSIDIYDVDNNDIVGSLKNNADGTLTFTPSSNYNGKASFDYRVEDKDGDEVSSSINIDVTPSADGITFSSDKTIDALEDNNNTNDGKDDKSFVIALNLDLPTVIDTTDKTTIGATTYDAIERLGLLSFNFSNVSDVTGYTIGLDENNDGVMDNSLFILGTNGNNFQIRISDGDFHPNDLTQAGVISLTKEQYSKLLISPSEDSANNVKFTITSASYEVDDNGDLLSPLVKSSESTQNITVDIQAVTDSVTLQLATPSLVGVVLQTEDKQNSDGIDDHLKLTFNEDATIDLKSVLIETFGDFDNSETHSYKIDNLVNGTVVSINGVNQTYAGSELTFTFPNNNYNPSFFIRPPSNFSGNILNASITLVSKDSEKVGENDNNPQIIDESAIITLDMHVKPVADNVYLNNSSTNEDSDVLAFTSMSYVDNDGSELVTKVVINSLETGWVLKNNLGSIILPDIGTNNYTINILDAAAFNDFKNYTLTPASHSSKDISLNLEVTTTDTKSVDGNDISNSQIFSKIVSIVVNPIAEKVNIDSDGKDGDDLTLNSDHTYISKVKEDGNNGAGEWFNLGNDGAFNLKDNWSNEDNDERTFAHLTLFDTSNTQILEASYRYDNGTTIIVLEDSGSGVDIPMEYLNTLEFMPPNNNIAGNFKIKVETRTLDADVDNGNTNSAISGESWLNLEIEPVADNVTISVKPSRGYEDDGRSDINSSIIDDIGNAIALSIDVQTDDDNETFNLVMNEIPNGGSLYYDGVLLDETGILSGANTNISIIQNALTWQITINNFDKSLDLKFVPPLNSDEDYTFKVKAQSVDVENGITKLSTFTPELNLNVNVRDIADNLVNDSLSSNNAIDDNLETNSYTLVLQENSLDSTNKINLRDIFTDSNNLNSYDSDEKLTFKVYDLPLGTELEGATFLGGGNWLVTLEDLKANKIFILTDENYSGELNFKIQGITTDSANSKTHDIKDVSILVEPQTDGSAKNSISTYEDNEKTLDFSLTSLDEDGSETFKSFQIDVTGLETSGHILKVNGIDISTSNTGYQTISLNDLDKVVLVPKSNFSGAYTLLLKYTIEDTTTDNNANNYTQSNTVLKNYIVNVIAQTDEVTLTLDSSDVIVDENTTTFTKQLTLNSVDIDTSEEFTRLEISGVPSGVEVENGIFVGGTTGVWYVDISNINIASSGAVYDLTFNTVGKALTANEDITIKAVAQDEGNKAEKFDIQTFSLNISSREAIVNTTTPAIINSLEQDTNKNDIDDKTETEKSTLIEDTEFSLGSVVDIDITGSSKFTILLDNLPSGITIEGISKIAGKYIISGDGGQGEIQNILNDIKVTAPKDFFTNSADIANSKLNFDITLTTYSADNEQTSSKLSFSSIILPATDNMDFTGSSSSQISVQEDEEVNLTLKLSNQKDGTSTQIIDGKVYIKITETYSDIKGSDEEFGILKVDGSTITLKEINPTGLPEATYFVLDGKSYNDSININFEPANNRDGEIKVDTFVKNNISHSYDYYTTNTLVSQKSFTIDVKEKVDGFDITPLASNGDEDRFIELKVDITPKDSSEELVTFEVDNVPNNFLVYYGEVGARVIAQNVGDNGSGNNFWNIPMNSGLVPKIWISPPYNFSGDISGLTFIAIDKDRNITTSSPFDVTIEGVADKLELIPTKSFGIEGNEIPINLSATLTDRDGSETVTLTFKNIGENAVFKADGIELSDSRISYDKINDIYTLNNISKDEINDLTLIQKEISALVEITAKTVESDGAESDLQTTSFQLDISTSSSTIGDDELLYYNQIIDANTGFDTLIMQKNEDIDFDLISSGVIKNIEKIDLNNYGEHSLFNIELDDIIDITDENNELYITGDNLDTIILKNSSKINSETLEIEEENWQKSDDLFSQGVDSYHVYTNTGSSNMKLYVDINIDETVI